MDVIQNISNTVGPYPGRFYMCNLNNPIVHDKTLQPSNLSYFLDVPVFKGGSKDPLEVDSNRKMSLVSIMSNVV